MPITYEAIATTTSSGGTSISFTSIPATYTDLVLVFAGDTGGGIGKLEYNGDTGSNYSSTILWGNGINANSARYDVGWTFVIPGTAGNLTIQRVFIQNYSNTTTYKTSISRCDVSTASTTEGVQLWRSTSAINRVDLISSGTYGSYTCTLYGIKAA
jgi:hypothetical protein